MSLSNGAPLKRRVAAIDASLRVFLVGHLGDGNLHITVTRGTPLDAAEKSAVSEAVYRDLRQSGGAISAEHGIGLDKRDSLRRHGDPAKLAVMRTIKLALDPTGIMNPGKVI